MAHPTGEWWQRIFQKIKLILMIKINNKINIFNIDLLLLFLKIIV